MGDLLGSLGSLFGAESPIMKMLGGEGMKNLIAGGTGLYQASQTGDMLDFQKGLATNAEARTQTQFDNSQKDREFMQGLDFA